MKKIRFLENFEAYRENQVAVVQDHIATALVALGKAKMFVAKPQNYQNRMLTTSNQPAQTTEQQKRRGRPPKPSTETAPPPPSTDAAPNLSEPLNRALTSESE